ncbi:hypothetical protein EDD21DRAFT_82144 [Dissophora ornata]|nr:hypothetical protein EDD21DRAFT_82144 [Dissophora ornata]
MQQCLLFLTSSNTSCSFALSPCASPTYSLPEARPRQLVINIFIWRLILRRSSPCVLWSSFLEVAKTDASCLISCSEAMEDQVS